MRWLLLLPLLALAFGCSDLPTEPASEEPNPQFAKKLKSGRVMIANEVTLEVGNLAWSGWQIDVAYCANAGFDVDHTFTVSFEVKNSKGFFEWYEDGDNSTVYSADVVKKTAWFPGLTGGFHLGFQSSAGHLDDVYGCFNAKSGWPLNPPVVVIRDGDWPNSQNDMFAAALIRPSGGATVWLDILGGDIEIH